MPTEAEWEYACRAGGSASRPFHFGSFLSSHLANFDGNQPYGGADKAASLKRTTRVGSYPPNAFGLYDMHGNVLEWCEDWYGPYDAGSRQDPRGPATGTKKAVRGGSWFVIGKRCRAAYRGAFDPPYRSNVLGFRVVLVAGGGAP